MPAWIQAILYITAAIVLLRFSGKRTLSQMTPGEVVIMIGIGTVLVHPLKSDNSWITIYHGGLIVLGLIVISLLIINIPALRKWILGEPLLLIKNGEILLPNLKIARMSVDELKMRLRIKKVNEVSKVMKATLEVSGDIGLELFPEHNYVTKKDFENFRQEVLSRLNPNNQDVFKYKPPLNQKQSNLFNQVEKVQDKDPLQ
ncbi:DUF421 domain-containing protein [Aquibacillus halophilus]|uniref:DUF421 domain-containing protein n=1 Tax=Aquibacillus halophilus TaxID=930132 RepID=A0A6A8DDZ4_9BACI|nr:YetF domain-containing protein [Aquibacillus halophilus]MRH43915.1 DUF421 domain-containing protein [Aquibacillus halophilus]